MTRRALLSVSDKTGIVEFARALHELSFEILSTGGTAKAIREGGVSVRDVSDFTGSPEVMDGRVKTLHPRVHGGILARGDRDAKELSQLGGAPIELVCVNLYPFEETVARGAKDEETIENIDIGGPSMVRSAAKNHERVIVVTEPGDYDAIIVALQGGDVSQEQRRALAAKAFAHTSRYDGAIAAYLSAQATQGKAERFPRYLSLHLEKRYDTRYGENPHQRGAFYAEHATRPGDGSTAGARSVGAGGKELSFNNWVDLDATVECVREFSEPAAVVVKHTNPCGVARAESLVKAYELARAADPVSAFGGIVALNRGVDLATAELIAETFIECVIAPSFAADALKRLRRKKNLRLLATGEWLGATYADITLKRVSGGFVVQERDASADREALDGEVVTERAPTEAERAALSMGWKVCKHVKSNAIIFARGDRTVGVGAGQMSRVLAVKLAATQAGELAKGAAMASDAFFPFPDGVEAAAAAGITAVAQPGGSKRDNEVIAAANAAGIAMVFTGTRHFRH